MRRALPTLYELVTHHFMHQVLFDLHPENRLG
jgi:hypothetical protein